MTSFSSDGVTNALALAIKTAYIPPPFGRWNLVREQVEEEREKERLLIMHQGEYLSRYFHYFHLLTQQNKSNQNNVLKFETYQVDRRPLTISTERTSFSSDGVANVLPLAIKTAHNFPSLGRWNLAREHIEGEHERERLLIMHQGNICLDISFVSSAPEGILDSEKTLSEGFPRT